jgi:hypothetical protein
VGGIYANMSEKKSFLADIPKPWKIQIPKCNLCTSIHFPYFLPNSISNLPAYNYFLDIFKIGSFELVTWTI